jgi:hypothetical protein
MKRETMLLNASVEPTLMSESKTVTLSESKIALHGISVPNLTTLDQRCEPGMPSSRANANVCREAVAKRDMHELSSMTMTMIVIAVAHPFDPVASTKT